MNVTKRFSICGRFRHYADYYVFCVNCGNESLENECTCGRSYEYALDDENEGTSLHCPRCGRSLRGRSGDFE